MTQPEAATKAARRLIMARLASFSRAQSDCLQSNCAVWFGGWKDYYFRAPESAPMVCQMCATQGNYRYSDIRRENYMKSISHQQ